MKFLTNIFKRKQATWYQACSDLPLNRFIRLVSSNDLKALIIQGNRSRDVLIVAKARIIDECKEMFPTIWDHYQAILQVEIDQLNTRKTTSKSSIEEIDLLVKIINKELELSNIAAHKHDLNFGAGWYIKTKCLLFDNWIMPAEHIPASEISTSEFFSGFQCYLNDHIPETNEV